MEVQVFSAAPNIMKYIYKHGNQYWYQRAIPTKLTKILGKKTIKPGSGFIRKDREL